MASRSPTAFDFPPREPSPEPVFTPLPSPALRLQRSRQRLRLPMATPDSPPIPPTLIGSPLLDKCAPRKRTSSLNPDFCPDAHEFGAQRPERLSPPSQSGHRRTPAIHRRTSSISISPSSTTRINARARSPPPTPRRPSIAPPVPPIPDFVRTGASKAALKPSSILDQPVPVIDLSTAAYESSVPKAEPYEGMTCLKFFSLHNRPQAVYASVRAH
ncbi:hypothetical protein K488DRAFT_81792 [Vararia minispora EC-137]|uniref:Uncharacterized protein n=1 Tax=Vararia minispora EC-137 TaxID=1314806 RepID=A0ACB8QZ16_9AGAM|nr:hypothetical protein K488DRAFT_81792 [Vararia minispora EC-137]